MHEGAGWPSTPDNQSLSEFGTQVPHDSNKLPSDLYMFTVTYTHTERSVNFPWETKIAISEGCNGDLAITLCLLLSLVQRIWEVFNTM